MLFQCYYRKGFLSSTSYNFILVSLAYLFALV
nr:MAG TPA: hypothetical protein [Caudoviricetes sp.]